MIRRQRAFARSMTSTRRFWLRPTSLTQIFLVVLQLHITALILVMGVIVAFMGLRQSLFVAAAIPLSMLMGFMVLDALPLTPNRKVDRKALPAPRAVAPKQIQVFSQPYPIVVPSGSCAGMGC